MISISREWKELRISVNSEFSQLNTQYNVEKCVTCTIRIYREKWLVKVTIWRDKGTIFEVKI